MINSRPSSQVAQFQVASTMSKGKLIIQVTIVQIYLRAVSTCFFASHQCPNQHIHFWLYKNTAPEQPLRLQLDNLDEAIFEPKSPLKILLHGYNGSRDYQLNPEVRPVLLKTQPVHVLSVDYAALAPHPCYYPWAVQNAYAVSKCLAQLLDQLIELGIYTPDDFHIIGFSLGAQIAGLTANYVQHRLKRITGLDPARPGFMSFEAADKLDASDADFVDVIHTDTQFFAYLAPSGHADFYPNFGFISQSGCTWERRCSHFRAPIYYAESITTTMGFWSYNCGDWLEFLLQRCPIYGHLPHENMGYFVSMNASGSFFLSTYTRPPFAKGPLAEVEFEVFEDTNQARRVRGADFK